MSGLAMIIPRWYPSCLLYFFLAGLFAGFAYSNYHYHEASQLEKLDAALAKERIWTDLAREAVECARAGGCQVK